jgi:hypothetical protein
MMKHLGRAGLVFILTVLSSFIGQGLLAVTEGQKLAAYAAQIPSFQLGLVAAAAVLIVGMLASAALTWMMKPPRVLIGERRNDGVR